jgi:hypothetical protein
MKSINLLGLGAALVFAATACGDDSTTGTGTGGTAGSGAGGDTGATGGGGASSTGGGGTSSTGGGGAASTGGAGGVGGASAMAKIMFNGSGYGPHNNKDLVAQVSAGAFEQKKTVTVTGGTFAIEFTDIPPGTYTIDYYADDDDNGMCTNDGDHRWTETGIVVSGSDVTKAVTHNTNFSATACAAVN